VHKSVDNYTGDEVQMQNEDGKQENKKVRAIMHFLSHTNYDTATPTQPTHADLLHG
jgi:hypothetical protein